MSLLARYSFPTSLISNVLDEFYPITSEKFYRFYQRPYRFVPLNDNTTRLEVELPGYQKDEIEVYTEKNRVVLSAKSKSDKSIRSYNYSWDMNDYEKIEKVKYENGMLLIDITKILPDEHKRKTYQIE